MLKNIIITIVHVACLFMSTQRYEIQTLLLFESIILPSIFAKSFNRPFSSCLEPLFQNESWCTTFVMEINNKQGGKTYFHKKVVHPDSF